MRFFAWALFGGVFLIVPKLCVMIASRQTCFSRKRGGGLNLFLKRQINRCLLSYFSIRSNRNALLYVSYKNQKNSRVLREEAGAKSASNPRHGKSREAGNVRFTKRPFGSSGFKTGAAHHKNRMA
jgi:hypothetical protein